MHFDIIAKKTKDGLFFVPRKTRGQSKGKKLQCIQRCTELNEVDLSLIRSALLDKPCNNRRAILQSRSKSKSTDS